MNNNANSDDKNDTLGRLKTYANDIATAAKILADHLQDCGVGSSSSSSVFSTPQLAVPRDAPYEVHRARCNLLNTINRLQTLLAEPADFIQQLASQTQLLACLRWLGEFQVLACVPLNDSVPAKDVADLTGVPETQLRRIVRMTATAGFLHEPEPGYIAHTALSAPFVTQLCYLDAAMFLAETAAPAALQMAAATKLLHNEQAAGGDTTAYSLAFNTSQTFQAACEQRPKLQRQWPAFLRCAGDVDDSVPELLGRLDWLSLGSACIVDVCADSTSAATALAELFPALHFVVQLGAPVVHGSANGGAAGGGGGGGTGVGMTPPSLSEAGRPNSLSRARITVQKRAAGSPQTVRDAAVYMVRVAAPSCSPPLLLAYVAAELRAHLAVLRANPAATLVLAPRPLPDPGSVDPSVEAAACLRDLAKMQLLAGGRDVDVAELVDLVGGVRDGGGGLVVVNRLHARNSATVALGVKYRAGGDGQAGLKPAVL